MFPPKIVDFHKFTIGNTTRSDCYDTLTLLNDVFRVSVIVFMEPSSFNVRVLYHQWSLLRVLCLDRTG